MIRNKDELLNGENKKARKICLEVIEHALKKVNPRNEIRKNFQLSEDELKIYNQTLNPNDVENIYVIGAGKASQKMGKEIETQLSDRIEKGIIITKHGYRKESFKKIETLEGGHPLPDENCLDGTRKILETLENVGEKDLVINLISGGGSALLSLPEKPISLENLKKTTQLLTECGATINEINAVRKHISQVKGGKLAQKIAPGRMISLIVSDVVGDKLDSIASGPTVPDSTTFEDAYKVLENHSLLEKVPKSVRQHIERGKNGKVEETPKEEDFRNINSENIIISNNDKITEAAAEKGEKLGLNTLILSRMIEGESREVGKVHGGILQDIVRTETPLSPPAMIISGGETTVRIKDSKGEGGPNQEFVLGAARKISGLENLAVASIDTDGSDGPTSIAGGVVDGETQRLLSAKGLGIGEVLDSHDSKSALEKLNDTIITGPTGTNVNDLRVGIVLQS